jgi:predicted lipopolysaccharide heptosyltransferase III
LKNRNVLLVRLRLIGDVVFTTPAIRSIRRRFPDARLTYLVESEAAPVVLRNPHLDDVIVARRLKGLARVLDDLRLVRLLRARHFDTVVDFHGGPRGAWLSLLTGASMRIGYTIRGREWMYTHPVDRPRELRPRHSVVNQWDLLAPLDEHFREPPDPTQDAVEMSEDQASAALVGRRLASLGIDPENHSVVVVHVSAGNAFRRWPFESFVALIAALVQRDRRRRIVLTSGPSDREAAARIGDAARLKLPPGDADAIVSGEELNLPELHALIRRAALFVGGDSGPLHIAATTRTPIVAIYGPTLPIRSAPWRDPMLITEAVDAGELPCRPCDQRTCAPGDFRCLTQVAAEPVLAAAERALTRR